jgi:GNAT superfamily N-acetyltransferase
MHFMLREESIDLLPLHATVSIAYDVEAVLDLTTLAEDSSPAGLKDLPVGQPYVKDYDAIEANHPSSWPLRFDLTNWGLIGAYDGTRRIGGAVIAFDTPGLDLLSGERDALLWDLRVAPDYRRRGAGTALFTATESWARRRECDRLVVETQDTNPAACRFYAARGCTLLRITRGAYPEFPAETQLLWEKTLISS